jgi:LPXTG-site transpeptidase (sortase) family protein
MMCPRSDNGTHNRVPRHLQCSGFQLDQPVGSRQRHRARAGDLVALVQHPQRNVYLAGHRLGWPGTWSHLVFYHLDKLGRGDAVVLRDRQGRRYEYRVSETFITDPGDSWVMGQVRGRDMVTLQTCTPIPTFEKRIVVRADRV